jgi:hypothetical protein
MALLEMHRSPPASSTEIRDPLASSRAEARQREGWLLASSTLIIATSSPARAQEHGLADGLLKTPGQGYGNLHQACGWPSFAQIATISSLLLREQPTRYRFRTPDTASRSDA